MQSAPSPGDRVRILAPFAEAFPEVYVVDSVTTCPDGQQACFLVDVEGAFDPKFLEPAEVGQ